MAKISASKSASSKSDDAYEGHEPLPKRWLVATERVVGQSRAARFRNMAAISAVRITSFVVAIFGFIILAVDILHSMSIHSGHLIGAIALLMIAMLPFVTSWTRKPFLAALLLCLSVNVGVVWISAETGGILSPAVFFLVLPTFWGWLMLHVRASVTLLIATLFEIAILTLITTSAATPLPPYEFAGLSYAVTTGAVFGLTLFIGLISGLMSWSSSRQHEAELIKTRDEALQANREKSEFIASIAHEVRTPLTQLMGMIELLAKEEALTSNQSEMAQTARSSARNILSLINDLLDLSKMEVGELKLLPEPMNAVEVFQITVNEYRPIANLKGIQLSFHCPDKPVWLLADPTRFRQCLSNYLSNALKFTAKGSISARLSCDELDTGEILVTMSVADTGPGIPGNQLRKIFARFVQVDGTQRAEHGGTGLGLAIVNDLAHMQGGSAWVESEEGMGSTFYFRASFKRTRPLDLPEYARSDLPDGMTILIADDSTGNQRVLTRVLQSLGYKTISATDGSEALSILASQSVNAILMDMHMPVKDGPSTLTEIRKMKDDRRNTPVIGLSADNTESDMKRWTEAGVDGFVLKPVDFEILDLTIRRAIGTQRLPDQIADKRLSAS